MAEVERHQYDVVVIGAGGAGLRAVIEARERGLKVAVVTKSLFGKAHTVMAEGGCAAAMRNVNTKDSWQVHFGDTMRGSAATLGHHRVCLAEQGLGHHGDLQAAFAGLDDRPQTRAAGTDHDYVVLMPFDFSHKSSTAYLARSVEILCQPTNLRSEMVPLATSMM